jgi:hypothetical protein
MNCFHSGKNGSCHILILMFLNSTQLGGSHMESLVVLQTNGLLLELSWRHLHSHVCLMMVRLTASYKWPFLCGLAFLALCGLVPREPSRSCTTFYNLASEVIRCHFHHNLRPTRFWSGNMGPTPQGEKGSIMSQMGKFPMVSWKW